MSAVTEHLHIELLRSLGASVVSHSDVSSKPLNVDLLLPNPPRLRIYMYSLVGGVGTKRPNEFKAVLRVPRQQRGAYDSFDHSGARLTLLLAYRDDLDVFVLWDASLHTRFKNGGNIQVRDVTVLEAAAQGTAQQVRDLSNGIREVVLACQSLNLLETIDRRMTLTGGA